jgi:hypothetical protein
VPIDRDFWHSLFPHLGWIIDRLPEGPALYPDDYLTDQPERAMAAEMVRKGPRIWQHIVHSWVAMRRG